MHKIRPAPTTWQRECAHCKTLWDVEFDDLAWDWQLVALEAKCGECGDALRVEFRELTPHQQTLMEEHRQHLRTPRQKEW
jgi:hypothetical protein